MRYFFDDEDMFGFEYEPEFVELNDARAEIYAKENKVDIKVAEEYIECLPPHLIEIFDYEHKEELLEYFGEDARGAYESYKWEE